jgi:hypothetical protein
MNLRLARPVQLLCVFIYQEQRFILFLLTELEKGVVLIG